MGNCSTKAPVVQLRFAPGSLEEHKYYLECCNAAQLQEYILRDPQISYFFNPMINLRPQENKRKAIAKILKVKFGYVDPDQARREPMSHGVHAHLLSLTAAGLQEYIRNDLDVNYLYPTMPNFHDRATKESTINFIMQKKFPGYVA